MRTGREDGEGTVTMKGAEVRGLNEAWRAWVRYTGARHGRRCKAEVKGRRQVGQRNATRSSEAAALVHREDKCVRRMAPSDSGRIRGAGVTKDG